MHTLFRLATLLMIVVAFAACSAPAAPTMKPLEAEPGLESFSSDLLSALASPRDYAGLTAFMSDSWEVLIFRGNGEQYAPADAAAQMESYLLPPDNIFAYDEDADVAALLGQDPMEFYRGNATGFVFTTGWGEDGQDEAILVINQDATGRYFWQGILYSPGGF